MGFDFENPPLQDGYRLHHTVAPNRWCVTRQDLIEFRSLVKKHVADGSIVPSELDPFDPNDNCIGPCLHTIAKQLIIPVTQKAGNPSWALMLHPDGLECDLFVTHGWLEGIYEFIDKVVNSWPRGARHAYCCMLSNPQNLDIGDLISSPRIWRAYEAFIAYSDAKFIFTATLPLKGAWTRGAVLLALSLLAASGSGALFAQVEVNEFGMLVGGTIGGMPIYLLPAVLELPPLFCMVLHSCLRPSQAVH